MTRTKSPPAATRFQTQHAKVIRFEVSVGNSDADRTLEQFEADIRHALTAATVNNICLHGAHYIIDGTVCLADDYDPQTQNRIPGTFPPQWAGGPAKQERRVVNDEEDGARSFVRVAPTRSNERDPRTGRRYRRDRGVKRGPRKVTEENLETTTAAAS